MEKRYGKFKACARLVTDYPETIIHYFKDVLILRVELNYCRDEFQYEGYSKYFDILEDGEAIPEYQASLNEKTRIVTWERKMK